MVNAQKTKSELEALLANKPLWEFVHLMATTGRPLRDVEIIALLKHNGFRTVSRAAISQIKGRLGLSAKRIHK